MASDFKWDIGVATLTTKDADGFIGVQVDVYGDQESAASAPSAPPFEAFMPPGLYCRPRDPDTGPDGTTKLGANVLYAWEGNTGYAFPMHDPRVIAKLPNTIAPGDAVLYCDRDDGQVSIMRLAAKDGAFIAYCPAPGGNGNGAQLRFDAVNGLDISIPWGRFKFGPAGLSITLTCGASYRMGPVGGFPDPVGSIMEAANIASRAQIKAGSVSIQGGLVNVGTDGGVANEAGVAALLAAVTAMVAAFGEISTTPAAVGSPVFTPAQLAPITAALATLTTAINGIGKHV